MEREREAFEAITDNQNSTEPREGEEIESNREGGVGERVFLMSEEKGSLLVLVIRTLFRVLEMPQ